METITLTRDHGRDVRFKALQMKYLSLLLLFLASNVIACIAPPLPTTTEGATWSTTITDEFGSTPDSSEMTLWRKSCPGSNDSLLMITIEPVSGAQFICSPQFDVIQASTQFDNFRLLTDPEELSSSFCGDLLVKTTFAVGQLSNRPQWDPEGAFTLFWDSRVALDVDAFDDDAPQPVNLNLVDGNWVNPDPDFANSRQGLMFDFGPSLNRLFIAWFTYTSMPMMPPDDAPMDIGSQDQRWFTALLDIDGNVATGTMRFSAGGEFDAPAPAFLETREVGTISIEFTACDQATVTYSFDQPSLSREFEIIPLEKAVNPDGFSCET